MKLIVRTACTTVILTLTASLITNFIFYRKFTLIQKFDMILQNNLKSRDQTLQINKTTIYYNPAIDSINSILRPNITLPNSFYSGLDLTPYKGGDFPMGALEILSKSKYIHAIVKDFDFEEFSNQQPTFSQYYIPSLLMDNNGSYSEWRYARYSIDRTYDDIIIVSTTLIVWLIFHVIMIRNTNTSLFTEDYLLIRSNWTDNTSLIKRKLFSIICYIFLIIVITSTINILFIIHISDSQNLDIYTKISMTTLPFIFYPFSWILTSLFNWVKTTSTN